MDRPGATLMVLTERFPYAGGEDPFIAPEILHLKEQFARIIFAPRQANGDLPLLPKNVVTTRALARQVYNKLAVALRMGVCSGQFWCELVRHKHLVCFPRALLRLALYAGHSQIVACWLQKVIPSLARSASRLVIYSYWLMAGATAVALVRPKWTNIRAVSRCHRFDLYLEAYAPRYIPFREFTLRNLDHIFSISDHGASYLRQHYKGLPMRITTARLGVSEKRDRSRPSQDGVTRFVSCSSVVPVKRVDRIFRSLNRLSWSAPQRRFEWTHFGGGPGLEGLRSLVASEGSSNLKCRLHGQVANGQVLEAYLTSPVDCLINLSESEGIPVSVMEALSCGIPVLATRVGGVPEAVEPANGWLVEPEAGTELIAERLAAIDFSKEDKREASKRLWEERFNAERQYPAFAKALAGLTAV